MEGFDNQFSYNFSPALGSGEDSIDPRLLGADLCGIFDADAFLLEAAIGEENDRQQPDFTSVLDHDFTPQFEYPEIPTSGSPTKFDTAALLSQSSHNGANRSEVTVSGSTNLPNGLESGPYINRILNEFKSPTQPLRIIDAHLLPFEDALEHKLREEVERQKQAKSISRKRPYGDAFEDMPSHHEFRPRFFQSRAPAPTPIEISASRVEPRVDTGKKARNKRPENIKKINPANFYHPLPNIPEPWGSIDKSTHENTFQYTKEGELCPDTAFTVDQIIEFIGQNPRHNITGNTITSGPDSGLNFWIQTVPADSSRRYPASNSDKCRFFDCPDPRRTIRKGEFRVAFDELSYLYGGNIDPYHNAGYAHLYCLEKFVDFPGLCRGFNVLADTRQVREGRNNMAITRDHPSMAGIVEDFVQNSLPWKHFPGGRPDDYYKHTLCYQLTKEHLRLMPAHTQRVRERRGGNRIDIHLNNLDVYVANQHTMKDEKSRKQKAPGTRQIKRKFVEFDDFVPDDSFLYEHRGLSLTLRRSPRVAQRVRMS